MRKRMELLWWTLTVVAVLLGACVFGCGVEGIHSANPKTMVRVDPWTRAIAFEDNKDNDILVENMAYDRDSGTWSVDKIDIKNSASAVRTSNVDQIDAIGRQTEVIGKAWQSGFMAFAELVRAGVPMFGGYAPHPIWGDGQPGAVPQGWIWVGPPAEPAARPTPTTEPADDANGQ